MAQIALPMHCPDDIMPWIRANGVRIVDDTRAPYEVTFEAPAETLVEMLNEGWVDGGAPLLELLGNYIQHMECLTNDDREYVSDLVRAAIRIHLSQPNLDLWVNVDDGEFLWLDDDTQAYMVNTYEFTHNPEYRGAEWSMVVGPMPVKSFQ